MAALVRHDIAIEAAIPRVAAEIQADATKQANSDMFFGQNQVTSDGVTF